MNRLNPVFTEKTACQDCYKCLRECPVKAIQVENNTAAIVPELCIACGHCVQVCPVGAKKVRDDVGRAKQVLRMHEKVYVSLAPSYVVEFPGVAPAALIAALQQLGFAGVSETALGAQEVSAWAAERMAEGEPRALFSSACPAVVDLIRKYHADRLDSTLHMRSPLLAHAGILRREFGRDIGIVFVGPCIAKKNESDANPHLVDAAITFAELREWFSQSGVDPKSIPGGEASFVPARADEGVLYPVDGGMIAGIKANCTVTDIQFMSVSGLANIRRALRNMERTPLRKPLFLELLACEGGCVNGPRVSLRDSTVLKRHQVLESCEPLSSSASRKSTLDLSMRIDAAPVAETACSAEAVQEVLASIGKRAPEDELNCGGCGYDTCRDFAKAIVRNRAERSMCVSHMRRLAQNKANIIIRTMPDGVVIVDDRLRIVECNRQLAQLLGDEVLQIHDALPGLEGAVLEKIIPFHHLFRTLLESGESLLNRDVRTERGFFNVTVFTVEKHRMVGGIVRDVTAPLVQKERIIRKADEVIRRNVETVQKIAYLLGENAADSEAMLNSIIESFSAETVRTREDADGR